MDGKYIIHQWYYRHYRYTAYRQMIHWCWGWLGRHVRLTLPSCAVTTIRQSFPSTEYTGFTYPNIQ